MVGGIDSTDFTGSVLADVGQTLSRIPVTVTQSGNGDAIYTEGTASNITGVILRRTPIDIQDEQGLTQTSSAYIMVATSTTINKYDIIVFRGNRFRVLEPISRYSPTNVALFTYADLVEYGDE